MNNPANTKSIYGKLSLALAAMAVFTLIFAILNIAVFQLEPLHKFIIFALPAIAVAGSMTGVAALLKERAVAGFIINMFLILFIFVNYLLLFTHI